MLRRTAYALLVLALAGTATACGRAAPDPATARSARGPITVWLSNNAQEVQWGERMVAAWNKRHPDQRVTAQQIPAKQDVRGGHQRLDHRRDERLPGLQHLTRRGADLPEAERSGLPERPAGR